MAYAETVERLRKIREGQQGVLTELTKGAFGGFVSTPQGATPDFRGASEGAPAAGKILDVRLAPSDKTDRRSGSDLIDYERRVRAWLAEIGETEPECIEQVVTNALADPSGLSAYVSPPEGCSAGGAP